MQQNRPKKQLPRSERKRGIKEKKDPARRNYIIWCQIASGVALFVFLFRVAADATAALSLGETAIAFIGADWTRRGKVYLHHIEEKFISFDKANIKYCYALRRMKGADTHGRVIFLLVISLR